MVFCFNTHLQVKVYDFGYLCWILFVWCLLVYLVCCRASLSSIGNSGRGCAYLDKRRAAIYFILKVQARTSSNHDIYLFWHRSKTKAAPLSNPGKDFFPTTFMLEVSFSPVPECVVSDCWKRAFRIHPVPPEPRCCYCCCVVLWFRGYFTLFAATLLCFATTLPCFATTLPCFATTLPCSRLFYFVREYFTLFRDYFTLFCD